MSFMAWWALSGVSVIVFGVLFLACLADEAFHYTWVGGFLYLTSLMGLATSLLAVLLLPFVWTP